MSEDYDFGFSFADSEPAAPPVVQTTQSDAAITALQEKLDVVLSTNISLKEDAYRAKMKEVEGLILPLLYNLMKNPEKAYIKWENRVEVIQRQIDKITAITRG